MQNRLGLIKFLLILCILSIGIGTWFIVKSVDLLRFEVEKLQKTMQEIPHVRTVAAPVGISSSAAPGNIANSSFYDPDAQSGGRFISVSASDTKNMNDLITNDAFLSAIVSYTQDSVAERNYKNIGEFQPKLAESWERLDDGMRFRIHLRKGVLWHDFTDPVTKKEWKNPRFCALF